MAVAENHDSRPPSTLPSCPAPPNRPPLVLSACGEHHDAACEETEAQQGAWTACADAVRSDGPDSGRLVTGSKYPAMGQFEIRSSGPLFPRGEEVEPKRQLVVGQFEFSRSQGTMRRASRSASSAVP